MNGHMRWKDVAAVGVYLKENADYLKNNSQKGQFKIVLIKTSRNWMVY